MATNTKDYAGIIRAVYDDPTQSLNVNIVGSGSPTVPSVVRLSDGSDYLTTSDIGSKVALDVAIQSIPELIISADVDNIAIGDGTNLATLTQESGKVGLDVNLLNPNINSFFIDPTQRVSVLLGAEISNVAAGVETPILTYTVSNTDTTYLELISASGSNISVYRVYVNNVLLETAYTSYGSNPSVIFDYNTGIFSFPGAKMNPGDVIEITGTHTSSSLGSFSARLQGIEIL